MGDAGSVAAFLPYISVDRAEWCDELCAFLRKAVETEASLELGFLDPLEVRMAHGRTAFLRACTEGHVECMELLAQVGCDATVTGNYGANALMCTAHSGEAAAVRAALDAGWCEPDARSRQGITAFLAACNTGDTECMELLVHADCDTSATDNIGSSALMCAAFSGKAAAVRAALDAGWCELDAINGDGITAFLAACNTGDTESMELLVQAGCNTAAMDSTGANALIHTASSGEAAAVRAALDAGWCDLDARGTGGFTAFLRACNKGDTECMELLVRAGCDTSAANSNGINALIHTVTSGKEAAVRAALDADWCDLEAGGTHGLTAFLHACRKGDTECMELLVRAGCDTSAATDSDGCNALMHTVTSSKEAAVRAALDAGWCDLEARDTGGVTAFLRACNKGDAECMKLLVQASCDTAATDSDGCNALMHTAMSDEAAAVRAVLDAGWCDLEARNTNGAAAFLFACSRGSLDCMELLVQAGCNISATDNDGSTALMYAALYRSAEALKRSEAAAVNGVNVAASGANIAKASGNDAAVQWLHALDTKRKAADLQQQAQQSLAAGNVPDAKAAADKALTLLPDDTDLARLQAEIQSAAAHELEEKERKARLAEAELMAMLDGDSATAASSSVDQGDKARRKKEKRRRQRQAKREAAAQCAQATAVPEPAVQQPEPRSQPVPQPEPQPVPQPPDPQPEPATEPEPVMEPKPETKELKSEPKAAEAETATAGDYAELWTFLVAHKLTRHYDTLVQHEVAFDALVELAESDLQEIGLAKGPRVKMMKCAAKFRQPTQKQLVVPDEFCCPISQECMHDPVIVMQTGMSYEREAIVEWLSSNDTDPSTGVELGQRKQLAPNVALRKTIGAWREGTLGE